MIRCTAPLALLLLTTVSLAADKGEWITLFDGKSMEGWKVNENVDTWKLVDGTLTCKGERSHIFYVGKEAPFKDFELELEVLTHPNSNAGVYFHTKYQETGWPKGGFEAQVNNTYEKDPRKTGSLYAVQDVKEQVAKDNEWWTYNIRVEGRHVVLSVNGKVINDFTEPEDAVAGKDFERKLGEGTFALQGHDPGSTVSFKNIRVKRLGDAPAAAASTEAEKKALAVGDSAPVITLKDDTGKEWSSAETFGKGVTVVYFYPADFTGGCTKQACSYRDDFGKLKEQGAAVIGISGDSAETHAAFKQHHNLNFTLLADPEGKAAEAFGVPCTLGEKIAKLGDQQFVRTATIQRWTFVIKDGKVAMINNKVNAAEDSQAILKLLAE